MEEEVVYDIRPIMDAVYNTSKELGFKTVNMAVLLSKIIPLYQDNFKNVLFYKNPSKEKILEALNQVVFEDAKRIKVFNAEKAVLVDVEGFLFPEAYLTEEDEEAIRAENEEFGIDDDDDDEYDDEEYGEDESEFYLEGFDDDDDEVIPVNVMMGPEMLALYKETEDFVNNVIGDYYSEVMMMLFMIIHKMPEELKRFVELIGEDPKEVQARNQDFQLSCLRADCGCTLR